MPISHIRHYYPILFRLILGVFLASLLALTVYVFQRSHIPATISAGDLNEQINKANEAVAAQNPFGFTDRVWAPQKAKGTFRIAVIGDSFIWGDGLPYEKAWGHKLEKKILSAYDSIEVLNWGRCGWSTLDEFKFLKEHGRDYDIDLLIVGWVDNDVDVGKIEQGCKSDAETEYPLLYMIHPALAENRLNHHNRKPYDIWISNLYGKQNLGDYRQVLDSFHLYLMQNNIPVLMVMTPGTALDERAKHNFELAKPLLMGAGFRCLDLYTPSENLLQKYDPMQMQANAVNGHPGEVMTEEFANDVMAYLEQNACLARCAKKH